MVLLGGGAVSYERGTPVADYSKVAVLGLRCTSVNFEAERTLDMVAPLNLAFEKSPRSMIAPASKLSNYT